ncbi:hypothetical protein LXP63_12085 [Yersinia pestis subsp. pestis]|nr:hypothetical protein [Yersinia pestis]MCF2951501.1 hypothetical protein [Yersinia pestis subsp. pestis]MCD9427192.1 hypothetical protein [Yersinia pestis]MCD9451288.1 hypothetical protein [Yersinia pestis]MCF2954981.1 hypothetical protein [Yersinia pestis subsp. pestis]MCF2961084.1 hypothetical protein [Yersinia pestis subsp. pestis]
MWIFRKGEGIPTGEFINK